MLRSALIAFTFAFPFAASAQTATPARPAVARDGSVAPDPRSALASVARRAPASTVAVGTAVASAADPRAAAAGAEMLRMGGTAADAAGAIAIALTVVEPQSSGLGGGGFFVIHDAKTGRIVTLDGRESGPAAARADRFLRPDGKPMDFGEAHLGGRSVGVPGTVALIAAAHARFGKLPWAALFQPAIRLAREGFLVTPRLHAILVYGREIVAASSNARLFLGPDGAPLPVGARVRNPALAATLAQIAAGGPDAFYHGAIAEGIARAVSNAPRGAVPFTPADLAAYRVVERTPICGQYRGYRVCGIGPPSSGGVALIQILGQLERFDLKRLGRGSVVAWHLLAESERLAYADREAWLADPGFTAVPTDGLIDPVYIAARSALIDADRAMPIVPAGTPPGAPRPPAASDNEVAGTSDIAVADAAGNVVSYTTTIESIFGSGQVTGGFFLNNELTDFDFQPVRAGAPAPNRLEPGKRPRSSMAPTLIYAPDGSLYAAVGAAGGATIIAQVAKTVIALIDWGLPIEDAIAEPVLYANGARLAYERGSRLEALAPGLAAMGHQTVAADLPGKTNAVVRTRGGWRGAGDVRGDGLAVATR